MRLELSEIFHKLRQLERGCADHLFAPWLIQMRHFLASIPTVAYINRGRKMATYKRLQSGRWRVQVRRKGRYASRTFHWKSEAEIWAMQAEQAEDTRETVSATFENECYTCGHLVDFHVSDMVDVGRPLLRSKSNNLEKLKSDLGRVPLISLSRECLNDYGKSRAIEGAGPATVGMDFTYIKTILIQASAVHGIEGPTEQVALARVALTRLGIIGKGVERN